MTGKRRLGALFFDKFELLDIFGPLEMFGVLPDRYEIVTVAERKPSIASTQGPSVTIDRTFADCGQLDVLLVPGGIGTRGEVNNPALLQFIRISIRRLTVLASICTGAGCSRAPACSTAAARRRTSARSNGWSNRARKPRGCRKRAGSKTATSSHRAASPPESTWRWRSSRGSNSDEMATGVAQHTEYDWHRDASWDPFAKLNNLV